MTKTIVFLIGILAAVAGAEDWPQFRGPNASGVSSSTGLPVEFGPEKNLVWKTPLPFGQSSPVLAGGRIFLTAVEDNKIFTFSLDRATGRIEWRREIPAERRAKMHKLNGPAAPTPASDGTNVYAFFHDLGLISFGPDGNERWRVPLGPFTGPFGLAASPVLSGGTLVQVCDGESGAFIVAVDAATGKVRWRRERPEATRGSATPLLYTPPGGPAQVLVAGAYKLTSYAVATGEEIWFSGGLTWQLIPSPVLGPGAVYVLGWSGGADPGEQQQLPAFAAMLEKLDADRDGKLAKAELTDSKLVKSWGDLDLDRSGFVEERDWDRYRARMASENGFNAFRLDGKGDMTGRNLLWRYNKSLPVVPSPLLYRNVLYLVKEGGILTALDPRNGAVLKQGRIAGALGAYYASPVAADGKIFTASEDGKVSVLKAGGDWEVLRVNDFGEDCFATPAIADGKIYLRTRSALYCFARKD